jgi:hypothetical protein
MGVRYDELALGSDLQWDRGPAHVQAEVLGHSTHYLAGAQLPEGTGFRPDGLGYGGYALAGYRFARYWNVMPFVFAQYYNREDSATTALFDALWGYAVGLNLRPTPSTVLKLQEGQLWSPDNGPVHGQVLRYFGFQTAWVF